VAGAAANTTVCVLGLTVAAPAPTEADHRGAGRESGRGDGVVAAHPGEEERVEGGDVRRHRPGERTAGGGRGLSGGGFAAAGVARRRVEVRAAGEGEFHRGAGAAVGRGDVVGAA